MRAVLSFVAVVVTATFASVAPAAAKWSCVGPEYVCGSAKTAKQPGVSKTSRVENSSSKRSRTAHRSNRSKATSHRRASYAPAKHKAHKSSTRAASAGGFSGKASYYWQPQRVASGGWFNPNALTAAHKTLPFGTKVRVTNRNNGRSVVVTINDRGPYVRGRVIDLSRAAAHKINMQGAGVVPVSLTVLGRG